MSGAWHLDEAIGATTARLEAEFAARDDDRRAADLDLLDPLRGALDPRVERARAPELLALADLDLLPELDAAVAGEVDGERPRGGARGGVLRHAVGRGEHARLPAGAGAREAVHAHDAGQPGEGGEVGLERGDCLLARQPD